jgi:DNA repair exonuclease SbcCD ATPase subunit
MGRNASVTFEQVCAAADKLGANGINVTVRAIRELLGTGSMGTITRLYQQWREKKGEEDEAAARMLPAKVQRVVFELIDQEVARARVDIEEELHQAKLDMLALANENEQLGERIEELQAQNSNLGDNQAVLEGRISQLHDDLTAAHQQTAAERRNAELERVNLAVATHRLEQLARLERELDQMRASLEVQREARVRAEQATAVLEAHKAGLAQRLAELKEKDGQTPDGDGAGHRQAGTQVRPRKRTRAGRNKTGEEPITRSSSDPGEDSVHGSSGGPDDALQRTLC